MIANLWQKYHKIMFHASKSHSIELKRKLGKKLHKDPNIHIKRTKNWHTYTSSILTCKINTKQLSKYQETHDNFLGIFSKKFSMHRGSDSKNTGVYSKKIQETERKAKARG